MSVKRMMADLSDGVIVLPGVAAHWRKLLGNHHLEAVSFILTDNHLKHHFYNPLLEMLCLCGGG